MNSFRSRKIFLMRTRIQIQNCSQLFTLFTGFPSIRKRKSDGYVFFHLLCSEMPLRYLSIINQEIRRQKGEELKRQYVSLSFQIPLKAKLFTDFPLIKKWNEGPKTICFLLSDNDLLQDSLKDDT